MLFKDAIDEFTNWRTFKINGTTTRGNDKDLRLFCLFLRNPQIEDVTLNNVMEYLNLMKEIGWAHNSFISKCMALKKFFEFYNLLILLEKWCPGPDLNRHARVNEAQDFKIFKASFVNI
jgi:site-specific recombinase XerD